MNIFFIVFLIIVAIVDFGIFCLMRMSGIQSRIEETEEINNNFKKV